MPELRSAPGARGSGSGAAAGHPSGAMQQRLSLQQHQLMRPNLVTEPALRRLPARRLVSETNHLSAAGAALPTRDHRR
jgi:hypothetical protein